MSDGAAEGAEGAGDEGATTQRVDKWLWFARILKTRTLAAALVSSGKVRLNRAKIDKPGHIVRIGDVLTVTANSRVRLLKVTGVGERRGPSATAVTLYEELTPAADPLKPLARSPSQAGSDIGPPQGERPRGSGRPTKRERRQIDRLGDKFR